MAGPPDGGFTLLEVLVALVLFAIITMSMIPFLASGLRASRLTKLATEAKNLTVARLDAMRALPYHVAYQNGPFVDLLDEYYTNTSTASTSIPATNGTGLYVAAGTVPGQTTATSYYQVSFGSPPEPSGFSQIVYTQFIATNTQGSGATATTASGDEVLTPPSGYNSQATGSDSPVSLAVAVTVVTSYTAYGHTHTNRMFSEITDTGNNSPLVLGQAGARAVSLTSSASDDTVLSGVLTQVGLNANLSNESSAAASILGGQFSAVNPDGSASSLTGSTGAQGQAVAPPDPAGSTGPGSTVAPSTCSWDFLGPTTYNDLSATVASAQPRVPSDVESGSNQVSTTLTSNNQSACSDTGFSKLAFAFSNAVYGTDTTNPDLGIASGAPMVAIPDASGTGSPIVQAAGKVDTPALAFNSSGNVANPEASSASLTYDEPLAIFPNLGFVTDSSVACPDGYSCTSDTISTDNALVVVDLTGAQISCSAGQSAATGSYTGTMFVWEQPSPGTPGSYAAVPLNWSSGSAPPLPARSTTVGYTSTGAAVPLSTYIATWSTGTIVQQSSDISGDHVIPGAVTIDTVPTLVDGTGAVLPNTVIDLEDGRVSCVSEDNR